MKNAKIKLHNKGIIEFLGYKSYSILVPKNSNIAITPIKVDSSMNNFATMDIEIINVKGLQTPVAISTCNGKTSKLFLIDHILLKT